ncbi:TlpA family protein disulfide reductase [Aegicerativicinus sediminis]|uniref:TlpA family protein disulfide reductase n=1 Tax=Aegicerativicinus sediminis TaxID=2893202 RepID=UPI001E3A30A1|nr:hypothetical protein [Aegicerativicinus sediminis]
MMKFWTGFLAVLIFYSCNFSEKEVSKTYFGGQIINPKTDYVLFYQLLNSNYKVKDTFRLDANNKFFHTFENLPPGLYSFDHGNEFQNVYLDPNDSIWFRLNTNDFDESLVFSGNGSKKNNYLLKLYMDHENMLRSLRQSSKMEPEDYLRFIDSIRKEEIEDLKSFVTDKPQTEGFYEIAKANIDFSFYKHKEYYPFGHYGSRALTHYQDLPSDFYAYRDSINFNDEKLSEVRYYLSYLEDYFMNASLEEIYQNEHNHIVFDQKSLSYNLRQLELIDSIIDHKNIKNYILQKKAVDYIRNVDDDLKNISIANKYFALSSEDQTVKDLVKQLVDAKAALKPGNLLPNVELYNLNGDSVNLHDLTRDKITLIYFWYVDFKSQGIGNHDKASEIKEQYPGLNIVSIDYSREPLNHWQSQMKNWPIKHLTEMKFKDPIKGNLTLDAGLNKIILVNKKGKILNSNLRLYSKELATVLERLTKIN